METEYVKPFLTIEQQLNLLVSRGLIVTNRDMAAEILQTLNYYRFSAYSLTLRKNDTFAPSITFENIYELYCFDDELKRLIFKYTSFVEVIFRTHIAHYHAEKYGPIGYLNYTTFFNPVHHHSFLGTLHKELKRSKDIFVQHHKNNHYGIFPIWVAIEVTTFGDLSKLFKNLLPVDKASISHKFYTVGWKYIENWLRVCAAARNIAAHGGRFYNRVHSTNIKLDKVNREKFSSDLSFSFIFAIYQLLSSEKLKKEFINEIQSLFIKFPFSDDSRLGFPKDWDDLLQRQLILK
ncbi:MAG: Abi family protein [Anaerovorax sp.]